MQDKTSIHKTLLRISLILVAVGLVWTSTVWAKDGPTATPTQLTVAGTRGTRQTRTLLLQTDIALTGIKIATLDLTRSDGQTVLPAGQIKVTVPGDTLDQDGLLSIEVEIDLNNVPCGQFQGDLMIRHDAGTLLVPMTVSVKAPIYWPLAVMLLGVAMGFGVSVYRAQGKPRDQVLVKVGQLRAQMRSDQSLNADSQGAAFGDRINDHLIDVEVALQAEKWQDAESAVEKGQAVLTRWRKGREEWVAELAYLDQIVERLENMDSSANYVQAIQRQVDSLKRDLPDLDAPKTLQDKLEVMAKQIDTLAELDALWMDLNQLRMDPLLTPAQRQEWQAKCVEHQQKLRRLALDDEPGRLHWQQEIEADMAALRQLLAEMNTAEMMSSKGIREASSNTVEYMPPVPAARIQEKAKTSQAQWNLRIFTWVSYIVAVLFLAGTGFGELYVNNMVFGANPWSDYLALAAWGFGAEATRAAIVQMVQGWGLPGFKQS